MAPMNIARFNFKENGNKKCNDTDATSTTIIDAVCASFDSIY